MISFLLDIWKLVLYIRFTSVKQFRTKFHCVRIRHLFDGREVKAALQAIVLAAAIRTIVELHKLQP